jgi:hypothetical protein
VKFVPLADDDLPADFRTRLGLADGGDPHGERRHTRDDPPLPTLEIVNALSLARKEPPPRDWLIYGLIPAREITMLSGDGGTGKSLLALQLAVAMATGTEWAGQVPNRGRTMFISAEDDIAELHRRLAAIVRAQSVSIDDLESLDILPLAGRDAVLAAPRDSILKETALFKALEAKLDELRPDLLILDTLADLGRGGDASGDHVAGRSHPTLLKFEQCPRPTRHGGDRKSANQDANWHLDRAEAATVPAIPQRLARSAFLQLPLVLLYCPSNQALTLWLDRLH